MALVQIILRLRYPLTLWITLLISSFLLSPVLPEVIYRVDPLALLAATLRTYQRAGCDSEQLSLSCPRGTSISIELAQYGKAGDLTDSTLCPPAADDDVTTTLLDGVVHSGTEIEVKPPESCLWPNALQYSLLQTVVEACQKKRHCKFAATPKSIAGDPCPGIRKFVEIAYKCRPYEFRSKVACENDMMQLICNPYSRIAIYSASFGRTEYESVQCSQTQDTKEESNNEKSCLVSYATETVMQICHGRRRCTLSADSATFGKPCKPDTRMYLKVVYTCIPRKVLKDRYDTAPEPDEPQQTELDLDQDDLYDEDQFYKESEAIPPAPKLQGGLSNPALSMDFPIGHLPSSAVPPTLSRNDSSLEVSTENFNKANQNFLIPKYYNSNDDMDDDGDIFGNDIHQGNKIDLDNENRRKYFIRRNRKFRKKFNSKINESDIIDLTSATISYTTISTLTTIGTDNNNNNGTTIATIEKESNNEGKGYFEKVEVIGFLAEWIEAFIFLSQNQERFYLYLIVSVAAGVLLCLVLVIGRLIVQKRRSKNETKFKQSTTGETQLPNGFSDDISEIDADIDLTTPLPVPSLSSRNEAYMTYAPSPNTYGSSSIPSSSVAHTATTILGPKSGLVVSSGCGGSIGGGGSRQPTPPPNLIGPSSGLIGGPSVSGAMGALMPISSVSHHTTAPSYFTGALLVGHHGTLRRPLIPPTSGVMATSSQAPPLGIVTTNICYDGNTISRTLSRGIPDNTQYLYG